MVVVVALLVVVFVAIVIVVVLVVVASSPNFGIAKGPNTIVNVVVELVVAIVVVVVAVAVVVVVVVFVVAVVVVVAVWQPLDFLCRSHNELLNPVGLAPVVVRALWKKVSRRVTTGDNDEGAMATRAPIA